MHSATAIHESKRDDRTRGPTKKTKRSIFRLVVGHITPRTTHPHTDTLVLYIYYVAAGRFYLFESFRRRGRQNENEDILFIAVHFVKKDSCLIFIFFVLAVYLSFHGFWSECEVDDDCCRCGGVWGYR